jgi:glutamyl-tRNA synthetase
LLPGIGIDRLEPLMPLVQERLRNLNEAPNMLRFFFQEPDGYPPQQLIPKGREPAATALALNRASNALSEVSAWDPESVDHSLRSLAEQLGWSSRDLFMTLRVAVTGRTVTPPLIESIARLPKDLVVSRVQRAAARLDSGRP